MILTNQKYNEIGKMVVGGGEGIVTDTCIYRIGETFDGEKYGRSVEREHFVN